MPHGTVGEFHRVAVKTGADADDGRLQPDPGRQNGPEQLGDMVEEIGHCHDRGDSASRIKRHRGLAG